MPYFTYLTKGNALCFVSGDWIPSASRHNQKEGVTVNGEPKATLSSFRPLAYWDSSLRALPALYNKEFRLGPGKRWQQ
jgi:hypothetical protein